MKNQKLLVAALLFTLGTQVAIAQQLPSTRQIMNLKVDDLTSSPLQLTKRIQLNAAPDKVFALLERYEEMPKWLNAVQHVQCDRTSAKGTNGIGTQRVCQLQNGATLTEAIVGFEPARLIAYSVSNDNPMGVRDHLAVVTTEPSGSGTLLTWRQYFSHPQAEQMVTMVDGMLDAGFQRLAKGYGGGLLETRFGQERIVLKQVASVKATPDDVWTVLGRDFGGLSKWASMVSHAELSKSPDGATQRACSTSMGEFKETLVEFDEAERALAYRVDAGLPPMVKQAVNRWSVTPTGDGSSVLQMRLEVQLQDSAPSSAGEMLKAQFGDVTRNTIEELAYYAANGKPHARKLAALQR